MVTHDSQKKQTLARAWNVKIKDRLKNEGCSGNIYMTYFYPTYKNNKAIYGFKIALCTFYFACEQSPLIH